ncbi:hypothetical protein F0L68_40195 [Solihabitans fulvus]|uniref:Aminoglycoside phosphotransferase domain-containing protein n=1 Tax=Solihabitans fulvus TaxID=1892852 RepID=A0A5B2W5U0_9PSEU|nr:phosphotransferase [Solihabitans fulvus]KAA2247303.1 hypothetical protein F0L68_40195 [Solihabitans fulvus]
MGTRPAVSETAEPPAPVDLRSHHHADVLDRAERALGVGLVRSGAVYGVDGLTVGMPTAAATWTRMQWRRPGRLNETAWTGAEAASMVTGVAKPAWLQSHMWVDPGRQLVWRVDELALVTAPVIGTTGGLTVDPDLPNSWWRSLADSLDALAAHTTTRVSMSQEHLTRRVGQVFQGVDTTIDEWTVAHGDLHWHNLTAPECVLLDWEDWGLGPRGLDAAFLWGASLRVPQLAQRVEREFAEDMASRSGRLARLLFCANVIRLSSRRPGPNALLAPARATAEALLRDLRA